MVGYGRVGYGMVGYGRVGYGRVGWFYQKRAPLGVSRSMG